MDYVHRDYNDLSEEEKRCMAYVTFFADGFENYNVENQHSLGH